MTEPLRLRSVVNTYIDSRQVSATHFVRTLALAGSAQLMM